MVSIVGKFENLIGPLPSRNQLDIIDSVVEMPPAEVVLAGGNMILERSV